MMPQAYHPLRMRRQGELACRTMRQRVLLASNRGPFSYWFGADGTLIGRPGGGGLISGMTPGVAAVAAQAEVIWICAAFTDADRAAAREWAAGSEGPAGVPAALGTRIAGDVPVRMLDIPPGTFHRAYNNVANSALWFVHHMLFDTPHQPLFGREFRRDWESYLGYNQAFADALAEQALAGDARYGRALPAGTCALIQDYHLSLVPRLLRERLGEAARDIGVAHFSHTPWAPLPYYRLLPREVARALLDGMLGADHLGFHAKWWASAFLDCCEAILGADVRRPGPADTAGRVVHRGHVTEVGVHPLGVDAPALRARAAAGDVQGYIDAIRQVARGRKLIVRVDRIELSKNIVRGLAAYRELLTTRPQWHGRVLHLAFAYPSRSARRRGDIGDLMAALQHDGHPGQPRPAAPAAGRGELQPLIGIIRQHQRRPRLARLLARPPPAPLPQRPVPRLLLIRAVRGRRPRRGPGVLARSALQVLHPCPQLPDQLVRPGQQRRQLSMREPLQLRR